MEQTDLSNQESVQQYIGFVRLVEEYILLDIIPPKYKNSKQHMSLQ